MPGRLFRWTLVSLGLLAVAFCAPSAEAKGSGKKPDTVINVAAPSPTLSGVGTIATETARCPGETRALGGGFLTGGGIVFESRMIGVNAWRVSIQSRTGHLFGLVAYAYCRKGAPKTSAVSRTAVAGAAGPGTSLVTTCPGNKKALAGGFSTAPPVGFGLIDVAVTDSLRQSAGSWRTEALFGRAGPSVTGFAYCAKRQKKRTARTGTAPTVTGDDTPTTAVSPSCGKKTAVMGGFSQDGALGFGVTFPQYSQSQRAHKTWHVGANDIGGGPLTVSATAYCG